MTDGIADRLRGLADELDGDDDNDLPSLSGGFEAVQQHELDAPDTSLYRDGDGHLWIRSDVREVEVCLGDYVIEHVVAVLNAEVSHDE